MSASRPITKNRRDLLALREQGSSGTRQAQHRPELPGLPHNLHPAVQTHFTNVSQMARMPAPFHKYVVSFFTQHGSRLTTAREVAHHYESSARALETHGDERALRTLHLELRVCELLASRTDVTYLGLREDMKGQEIDVIATIAGVTYYFEAKTGETDNAQKRRLTARARQNGAGLIYVDGLAGSDNNHFSARHLEAIIALPADFLLLELAKRAIIKPSKHKIAAATGEVRLTPVTHNRPTSLIIVPANKTTTPRTLASRAYGQARALIKEGKLRDNMATLDCWLMRLPYEKLTYLWNKVAEEPTLAEERLRKLNDCERATWLAARPDLLEERLESLFADEHVESFLLRQTLGFEPANHVLFKPSFIELASRNGTQQLILERRSPHEALALLTSQNYPDDVSRYLGHPEVRDVILARDPDGTILAYLAANLEGSRHSSDKAPIRFIRAHKIDQDRQKNIKGLFFGMTAYVLDRLHPQWTDLPSDAPYIDGILLKIMDRFREHEFNGKQSPVSPSNLDPFLYDEDIPLTVIPVKEAKFILSLFKIDFLQQTP